MMITARPIPGGLAASLTEVNVGVTLGWLGQAGFLLRIDETVVLIDPYLSDHLATKYRGTRYPHQRMMPAPIAAAALPRVDLVICTHRHSDHMDPGTLPVIAHEHPACRFVVPAAEIDHALSLGLPSSRLTLAEAFLPLRPLADLDLTLHPIPAAHEGLQRDAHGRHHFLGYGMVTKRLRLYHSGDCIPYDGLTDAVRALDADLALLPVNGRDTERAAAKIPGNFTLKEAIHLCRETGIAHMIPHHFGLFTFNTLDPAVITAAARRPLPPGLLLPDTQHVFTLDGAG